jgi:hypothetical protein
MIAPNDEAITCTIHAWYMPNGKTATSKKCIVEGCDAEATYNLCNQHAIPGMVVEVGRGCTVVISAWLVAWAGRMRLITLNDYALGAFFGGRETFEDRLCKQGYTIHGLVSSEAALRDAAQRHPGLRMTPWLPDLPGNDAELLQQLEDQK